MCFSLETDRVGVYVLHYRLRCVGVCAFHWGRRGWACVLCIADRRGGCMCFALGTRGLVYGYLNALQLSLFDVQAYLAVAAGEISIAPESRGR